MSIEDVKLYTLNTIVLLTSLSNIEVILKILLLFVSIGYTAHKWIHLKQDRDDSK